ncbi:MAG: hypothetical protein WBE46_06385 [Dehalococcoidia bacterium]
MAAERDIEAADLKVRAQFLKDLFSRLESLLQIHCTGYLIVLSPQVDEVYIRLRQSIERLLNSVGFEELRKEYPEELIPKSFHNLSEDADTEWEYGLRQALNRFTGAIIEFCMNVDAGYGNAEQLKFLLEPYDQFIESFRKDKRNHEMKWLAKTESQGKRFKQQLSGSGTSETYVDSQRIKELRSIGSDRFDLSKIVRLCEELNTSYASGCYFSVAMLLRAIVDHVPPIFNCKSFGDVPNMYPGSKSFKESMTNLDKSLRKIADAHLHVQIRRSETLPNRTQVNFSPDLDVLLAEIVRILR